MAELDLPMDLRVEERFNKAVAIRCGPLYFALRIGHDYRECPGIIPRLALRETRGQAGVREVGLPVFDWEMYPSTPWNYVLVS